MENSDDLGESSGKEFNHPGLIISLLFLYKASRKSRKKSNIYVFFFTFLDNLDNVLR